ncbi:MAG: discoidin domain-containing protein [Cloacibacillus porcorum]|nr:discoidin domain-containing protein [Cloacibacillus porcorum]
MRVYGFKAPQERLGPQFFRSEQAFENANTGRFVRNAVLDGMTYGGNDLVPAFLKTCDAVHPLCGTEDYDGVAQSCYGALLDSVNNATTKAAIKSVCQPWNTGVVWAPGGTGVDAWLAVRLPENTLIERYVLVSTATTCPLSFKIQGSLDGSTWADLHVVENSGVWESSYTEKVFTIPEEGRGSYLWYRFYVTASNAATMSIRNFRLWRAQSVCDRGQLRVDASAGSPLLLSFMSGFASDGVTPVDYGESLSAAIVQALGDYDSEGLPISGAGAVPVDIFAKRDTSGSVVVSVEAASESDSEYFSGGMKNWQDLSLIPSSAPTRPA